MPKPRILPEPRRPINTLKDLDEHFDNLVGYHTITEGQYTRVEHISIDEVFCYVTLEFVQQYYLNHLMATVVLPGKWGYKFTPSEIQGVYKATGYISQC